MNKDEINAKIPFKFQIGDRVKIMFAKVPNQAGGYIRELEDYIGGVYTITDRAGVGGIWYRLNTDGYEREGWAYDERCLKRIRKAVAKAPKLDLKAAKPQVPQEAIIEAPIPLVEAPKGIDEPIKKVRERFRVGDEVICVNTIHDVLIVGDKYTITRINGRCCEVDGGAKDYFLTRFKHAIVYYEEHHSDVKAPAVVKEAPKMPSLEQQLREKTGDEPGTCSYAIETVGGEQRFHVRDVCHARIPQYDKPGDIAKLVLDIRGHSEVMQKAKRGSYHEYVNYILNYSPWSPVFHRKGLDHAMNYGVNVNVDKPMHQCQGAAVVLREGSEYCGKLPLFSLLLSKGYSGNVAYLLSASVSGVDGKFEFCGLSNGHKVLDGTQDSEQLFKFFRDGYVVNAEDAPYRESHARSKGIYNFIAPFVEKPENQINAVLRKGFKIKPGVGWDASLKVKDVDFYAYADILETLVNN
jgi:hypothetical protein